MNGTLNLSCVPPQKQAALRERILQEHTPTEIENAIKYFENNESDKTSEAESFLTIGSTLLKLQTLEIVADNKMRTLFLEVVATLGELNDDPARTDINRKEFADRIRKLLQIE